MTARVPVRAVEEFLENKCLQRASALAFATLFSLVPVAAIFFFIITKLEGFSEIEARVRDFLFRNFVPARSDVIREYVTQFTENVRVLGIFGAGALVVTAIFLFNTVEHTFNEIWRTKKKRPFLGKLTSLWTVLTVAPILIGVSFYLAAVLAKRNISFLPLWFLTYLLNLLAFWFAYQFIPYTQVRIRAAVVGAIVGGTLWEVAKGGFNWYIGNVATFSQIYGPLGTIPVFLLWLYLTWIIVLFGSEVAYAVQYPQTKKITGRTGLESYLEFYAVRTMVEIIKIFMNSKYGKEEEDTIKRLQDVGVPAEIMGDILNRLAEKKLILFTEGKEYVPARHPMNITVRDVVEAVSGKSLLAPEGTKDPISKKLKRTFEEVGEKMDSALDELDLQSLVDGEKG